MTRPGLARAGLNLRPGQRLSLNPSLRQSMAILAMRGSGIKRLARGMADDNPFLEVVLPPAPPVSSAGVAAAPDFDRFSHDAVHPVSLGAHLVGEIGLLVRDPDLRAVALVLAEHVSPAGWLDPEGAVRASGMGVAGEALEDLLRILQSMDPPGLFARDLAECLRIQLERMGDMDEDAARVLERLDHMGEGGIDGLAGATGLDAGRIETVLKRLRRCNPKPGAAFIHDEGEIFRPDLTVEAVPGGFSVQVNQESLPEIRVADGAGPADEAGRLLLKQARAEARMLTAAIRQRSEMLLAAGGLLARHQAGFLRGGERHIRPLTMQQVADRLDCHKATVSRLVADKLCQTPRGMLELRDFFATGLRQADGGSVAGRAVAARIAEAVAAEDRARPHSDDALAALLAVDGIGVARRTVAKYRLASSIPRWQDRRSPAAAGGGAV